MSVSAIRAIYAQGPDDHTCRSVLLALAFRLREGDGSGVVYPSVERIASDARLTTRTVRRALGKLEAEGWLTISRGGGRAQGDRRGATSRYHIDLRRLRLEGTANPDTESPLKNDQPGHSRPSTRTLTTDNPDTESPEQGKNNNDQQNDFSMRNGKENGGVSAHARYWADTINGGKYVASSAIRPSIAREMLEAGLVTETTLRERGVTY